MAEGAPALREALSAAVAARTQGREPGQLRPRRAGLDLGVQPRRPRGRPRSSPTPPRARDPLADDVAWAVRTVAGLGNVEHHVIPAEEMPLPYHGFSAMDDQLDEPCSAAVERDRWLTIARRAAARGSRLHLAGFGGDELLYGSLAHLHTLLRSSPRDRPPAPTRLRRQVPLATRPDAAAAVGHQPVPHWLARVADTAHRPAAAAGGAAA